jgi:hypothetical protein
VSLTDDYRCLRLGPLHQRHPGRSRSLVRHNDRLHDNFLLGHFLLRAGIASIALHTAFVLSEARLPNPPGSACSAVLLFLTATA